MLSLSDSIFISFFILLSNEPLESGNKSWAAYGSAIISGNVHLFILTGTISPEGVYCRFLFPKVLADASAVCDACGYQDFMAWIFAYPILEEIENWTPDQSVKGCGVFPVRWKAEVMCCTCVGLGGCPCIPLPAVSLPGHGAAVEFQKQLS